jgi:hypothetical protein
VGWVGGGRVSLTFASNADSWIERLTIATGERIAIMPPSIATPTTSPSWSIDGNAQIYSIRLAHAASSARVYALR